MADERLLNRAVRIATEISGLPNIVIPAFAGMTLLPPVAGTSC